jgi:hypothetical protein
LGTPTAAAAGDDGVKQQKAYHQIVASWLTVMLTFALLF